MRSGIVFPPRKILTLMDSSEVSMAAWRQSRRLGTLFGSKADALYVQAFVTDAAGMSLPLTRETARRSVAMLARLRRRLGPGVKINAILGDADVVSTRWARTKGYDLVVMGSHGRSGLARALMGSVAESVVRRSTVPVLVVRRELRACRRVLAPVNLLPQSYAGLAAAAQAALSLDARLTVLYVADPIALKRRSEVSKLEDVLEKLVSSLPSAVRTICRPRYRIVSGDPVRRIVAEASGHDLVVLTARVSRLIGDAVLGTTAERVLRHSPVPVLCVPSGAGKSA